MFLCENSFSFFIIDESLTCIELSLASTLAKFLSGSVLTMRCKILNGVSPGFRLNVFVLQLVLYFK